METKLEEYRKILARLDKAAEYFKTLENEKIESIESSKAYMKMVELIYRANELYVELSESNIQV
ncbi:hypothetical protein QJR30_01600 [Paraclostridium sordellii]|uniref:hypothetical protein n=1 Tax=Paraclostridium sordellii TaxID=1505 RepID=UPI0030D28C29